MFFGNKNVEIYLFCFFFSPYFKNDPTNHVEFLIFKIPENVNNTKIEINWTQHKMHFLVYLFVLSAF